MIRNWALVGQRGVPAGESMHARLGEIEATAAQALDEVRGVVHDLAPYNLERLGLARSVGEMVERMADASNVSFETRLQDVEGLSSSAQINLYRVLQEAVTNIVKHAGASRAWLEIDVRDGVLVAVVRDDGRGFAQRRGETGGFGLLGMSERVRLIGGRVTTVSAPGVGTTVTIELPLSERPA